MSYTILAQVLAEHDDLLQPYLRIINETRAKLANIVGMALSEMSPAEFRASLLAKPAFREYARLVSRFPLLRTTAFTRVLLHHFMRVETEPGTELGFAELAPFAHMIQGHHRSREPARLLGRKARERDRTLDAATAFHSLLELVTALRSTGEAARDLGQLSVGLVGSMEHNWIVLGHEAARFAHDPDGLARFIHALAGGLAPVLERTSRPLAALELFSVHLIQATARFSREHPELVTSLVTDADALARATSLHASALFLEHAPYAARRAAWPTYREVSLAAARHPDIVLMRWLWRAPHLLRRRFPLDVIRQWFTATGASATAIVPNMLLAIPLSDVPAPPAEILDWWVTAERLAAIHPFAASQFLRHVAAVRKRLGPAFISTWVRWGEALAARSGPEVAALYFACSEHFADLASSPDEGWFEALAAACAEDRRNIDWMRSDLWLRGRRRRHLGLAARWAATCARLRARFPRGPDARTYRLADLGSREARRHLSIWEKLAEHGPRGCLARAHEQEATVECLTDQGPTHMRQRLEDAVLARLGSATEWQEGAHPLLDRLREGPVPAELERAVDDRGALASPSRAHLFEAGVKARPGDVIALLRSAPDPAIARALFDPLRAAVRRRRWHYPALEGLFAEIESLPTDSHAYDRVRLSAHRTRDLLEVLPGAATSSCTDGPRGTKRELGLVHALHAGGFKVLISRPHPRRGWEEPQPFASAPGFLARGSNGTYLFVDSIELGGEAYRLRDGFRVLAIALSAFFAEIAEERGLPLCIFTGFRNAGGQELLAAYRRAAPHVETTLDLRLDAADLWSLGVRHFYSEAMERLHPPGLRSTYRAHPLENIPVLMPVTRAR